MNDSNKNQMQKAEDGIRNGQTVIQKRGNGTLGRKYLDFRIVGPKREMKTR